MFKDACQCRTKLSGGCNTYNKQPGLPMAEWRTVFTNSKHFLEVLWQSWANASSAVILFVRQIFDASDWTCIQGGHSPELIFNNKTTTTYQVSTPGLWRVNGRVTHTASAILWPLRLGKPSEQNSGHALILSVIGIISPSVLRGGWRQMMRGRKTEQQQVPGGFRESLNLSWNFFYSYYQMRTRNGKESWDKSYK